MKAVEQALEGLGLGEFLLSRKEVRRVGFYLEDTRGGFGASLLCACFG